MTDFCVRRDDLRTTTTQPGEEPAGAARPGEVQLRIDEFGITANNVTYAVFGDALGYWRFFPAPEGWGRVPAWGFARVLVSGVEGIAPGDRFYGYVPMSSLVTMVPEPNDWGFFETAPHRADLPRFYNRYVRTDTDATLAPEHDAANMVLRPLHMTAWLIADQLETAGWHGAGAVALTSASNKTAFATAHELARRRDRPAVIGLTSAGNRKFVDGLGCYDEVLTYEETGKLPVANGLVLVDMAGNPAVRRAVHEHAGDALRASIAVGATHWEGATALLGGGERLPGPRPVLFFAPSVGQQRGHELGAAELQRRVGEAWAAFLPGVDATLEVEHGEGPDAVARVFGSFVDGAADPGKAHVLSLP